MKITITLLCVWATLFLAGCDVKDPIYNTPHPDKGAIVITADWTQRGEGIATPSEYTTEAAGASFTLHEPVAALTGLFVPGRTELLGYNPAEHVTVKDGVATVDNDPDNAGMQHPEPGVLLGGTVTADVVADDTVSVVLPMRQLFRKIAFELTVSGGDIRRITGIKPTAVFSAPCPARRVRTTPSTFRMHRPRSSPPITPARAQTAPGPAATASSRKPSPLPTKARKTCPPSTTSGRSKQPKAAARR